MHGREGGGGAVGSVFMTVQPLALRAPAPLLPATKRPKAKTTLECECANLSDTSLRSIIAGPSRDYIDAPATDCRICSDRLPSLVADEFKLGSREAFRRVVLQGVDVRAMAQDLAIFSNTVGIAQLRGIGMWSDFLSEVNPRFRETLAG